MWLREEEEIKGIFNLCVKGPMVKLLSLVKNYADCRDHVREEEIK